MIFITATISHVVICNLDAPQNIEKRLRDGMAKKNKTNRLSASSAKQALHERQISSEIENREDAQASLRLKKIRSVSAYPELAKKTE